VERVQDWGEDVLDTAKDLCTGGLIRTAHGSCPCNDNENVENHAE